MKNEFNKEFATRADAEIVLAQGGYVYETMLGIWALEGAPMAAEIIPGDWKGAGWFVKFYLFK